MKQGVLPFQYEEEKKSTGMTALGGLDLAHVSGLWRSIGRHVRVREKGQGWSDSQVITSSPVSGLNRFGFAHYRPGWWGVGR